MKYMPGRPGVMAKKVVWASRVSVFYISLRVFLMLIKKRFIAYIYCNLLNIRSVTMTRRARTMLDALGHSRWVCQCVCVLFFFIPSYFLILINISIAYIYCNLWNIRQRGRQRETESSDDEKGAPGIVCALGACFFLLRILINALLYID